MLNLKNQTARLVTIALIGLLVQCLSCVGVTMAETPDAGKQYATKVFDRIKTNWLRQASEKRLVASQLTFVLNDDGTLSSSRLETGPARDDSGKTLLDILKQSLPLEAFPATLKDNRMEFRFTLTPNQLQMVGHRVLAVQNLHASESADRTEPVLSMMALKEPAQEQAPETLRKGAWQPVETMDMDAYVTNVQGKVKQMWSLPQDYLFKRVVADIMIDRDGSLLSTMLQESSGDKTVDHAALNAIQAAAPFGRVPTSAQSLPVQIEYIFDPIQSPSVEP